MYSQDYLEEPLTGIVITTSLHYCYGEAGLMTALPSYLKAGTQRTQA